ncbi:CBASS cGAMP synthase [Allopontixanthobacter sp.]|uniref:CBASS cGAMP synthase n=1 Tax=Allopontixanthobacter sp. TaxID=2906452 RepID=UPI002ABAFFD1|nr:CBASS cGAMP synthase [Allopontixanthobacter sp.]MDZ4307116.1 CBASS cGAMP synthase [Allopontixanthobacter sp.]
MAHAARLFFKQNSEQTLHARITPSSEQFESQQARWNDLADFLRARLKEDTGYPISTWLQGSYKFATQIRPSKTGREFDIDLGLYFEWPGEDDADEYGPCGFKEFVQNALEDYAADADNDARNVDDPKERCGRVNFEPDFHIDVPCYHLDRDDDRRALATETKGWETSDPKAMYKWFRDLNEDAVRALIRRLVRYLKMWAALKIEDDQGRPSSIMLTVLAGEGFGKIDRNACDGDDELLEALITLIADRFDGSKEVANPVDQDEDLNRLSDEANEGFAKKLREFEEIARRANAATNEETAAEIWTEAFEHFFPMPEDMEEGEDEASAANQTEGQSTALATYAFDPRISVRAVSKGNPNYTREGINSLPLICKNCRIYFKLENAPDLPVGASVRWTVRNKGRDAWRINDIGHLSGDGDTAEENSAYNGKHSMDVTVYQFGRIIGRRRVEIEVRGNAMPARQLPRRRGFLRR